MQQCQIRSSSGLVCDARFNRSVSNFVPAKLNANFPKLISTKTLCRQYSHQRHASRIVAFTNAERNAAASGVNQIPSTVTMFPTLLNNVDVDMLSKASSERITYHTSFWYDALVKEYPDLPHKIPVGLADYEKALRIWTDAYERSEPQLHQAVANKDGDVFVIALSNLKNTGSFLGLPPTGKSSLILGVSRLALDPDMKVHDVWSFRSGTAEERQLLVKHPADTGDVSSWAQGLTLYPATWPIDPSVRERAENTVHQWMHQVLGQTPNLNVLDDILAPDVQIYDGVSIKMQKPHIGAGVFKEHMRKLHSRYQFGGGIELASAISPAANLAFIHWTHCFTHRDSGKMSHVDGITLLVMDHSSKIVQMLDFSGLLEEQKGALLQDRHPVKL